MCKQNSITQPGTTASKLRAMSGPMARLASVVLLLVMTGIASAQTFFNDADEPFLPSPARTVSTVPANGDVNPYGVAFVDASFQAGSGPLKAGDILVSNFNNSANLQGTGTTIVRIPTGASAPSLFFHGKPGLGLSTALGTLRAGFVVVGNAPTTDGTSATAQPGSLLVINNKGQLLQSISGNDIQYPWDMALVDQGTTAVAFVSNALTGTVSRIVFNVTASGLSRQSSTIVGSGYVHHGDPAALFDAPTGLVYIPSFDVLFVASSGDNAVYAIHQATRRTSSAGTGSIIYMDNVHLHGPLGLAVAPNGHLLVANNDAINPDPKQPSEIVEFTTSGQFVKQISMDPAQGGSFGLAVQMAAKDQSTFAAVDDVLSTITIWRLNQ
jgi:hypothetical protein